jgi:WD40 repeat protein/serine/threonine protein kinase
MDRDRNLLFGILAVQLRMATPAQLVDVGGAWATDPSRSLPERMVEAQFLSKRDREILETLVEQAVGKYGGNSSGALEAFGGESSVHEAFSGSVSLHENGSDIAHLSTERRPPSENSVPSVIGVGEAPGRYVFVREHGRGGMGRILHVSDQYLGRDIALKELLPHTSQPATVDGQPGHGAATLARFLQEARVTGQLEHPSVVPVYELGQRDDGTPYYTMKLVRGQTLATCFEKAKSLRERLVYLPHFANLCHAIAYAHSRGIIHRDVKPGNVMIGEFGETVVIDWGLAKVAGQYDLHAETLGQTLAELSNPATSTTNTLLGQILGTPSYMPPEQARGDVQRIDERSDVYSLGAVLYTLLTGKPPFAGKSAREVLSKVKNDSPSPIHESEALAPKELIAICAHAMQKSPEQRYQTAKELIEDIQRFQSGALVEAYDYRFTEHLRRFIERYRMPLAIGAAAALGLATLAIFYHLQLVESNAREHDQRIVAEAQTDLARHENYFASIALAKKNLDQLEFDRAKILLANCSPEYRHFEWGLLRHLSDLGLVTIADHERGATCLSFSRDGQRLATGDGAGNVRVYDMADGRELKRIAQSPGGIRAVAFDGGAGRVAICSGGNEVAIWDWQNNIIAGKLTGHTRPVNTVAFSGDSQFIATGASDNAVKIWATGTLTEISMLVGHLNDVTSVSFSPDSQRLVSASRDNTATVWSLSERTAITTFRAHENDVTCTAFSPDGKLVATGSLDSKYSLCLWQSDDGALVKDFPAAASVNAIAFDSSGAYLADAIENGTAEIWDIATGKRIKSCLGHSKRVNAVAFDSSSSTPGTPSSRLATGSDDATVKFWDVATEPRYVRTRVELDGNSFTRFAVNAGCDRVVAAGNYGSAVVWDLAQNTLIETPPCETVDAMELSGNGKRLVTLRSNGSIAVIELDNGKAIWSGTEEDLKSAALNEDGTLLAIGTRDGHARVIRLDGGEALFDLDAGSGAVNAMAFSTSKRVLATGSGGGNVRVWELPEGRERTQFAAGSAVIALQFDRAGDVLAVSASNTTIWYWAETDKKISLSQGAGTTVSMAFNPDGERLATGNSEGSISLWETATGREVLTLDRELGYVELLAFSNDERTLAAIVEGRRAADTLVQWRVPDWIGDAQNPAQNSPGHAWLLASQDATGVGLKKAIEDQARIYAEANRGNDSETTADVPLDTQRYLEVLKQVANVLKFNRDRLRYQGRNFASEGMVVDERQNIALLHQLGIRAGDIITSIDNKTLVSFDTAIEALEHATQSGANSLQVGLIRDGAPVTLTLTAAPSTTARAE